MLEKLRNHASNISHHPLSKGWTELENISLLELDLPLLLAALSESLSGSVKITILRLSQLRVTELDEYGSVAMRLVSHLDVTACSINRYVLFSST